jgi:hypothetical protein
MTDLQAGAEQFRLGAFTDARRAEQDQAGRHAAAVRGDAAFGGGAAEPGRTIISSLHIGDWLVNLAE